MLEVSDEYKASYTGSLSMFGESSTGQQKNRYVDKQIECHFPCSTCACNDLQVTSPKDGFTTTIKGNVSEPIEIGACFTTIEQACHNCINGSNAAKIHDDVRQYKIKIVILEEKLMGMGKTSIIQTFIFTHLIRR